MNYNITRLVLDAKLLPIQTLSTYAYGILFVIIGQQPIARAEAILESQALMPIYHILHWNYRDDLSEEERARIEAELLALPSKVQSLKSLRWGPVVGGRNQSFTHSFLMLFDDMQGLEEYVVHPDHVRFAGPFKEACAAQVVVDFEVQGADPLMA